MPILLRAVGEGRRPSSTMESPRGRLRDVGEMIPAPFIMLLSMIPPRSEGA